VASKPSKIGLFHHCGGGNLGDDGTMEAVIQNIKSRWPDADLCGFSMNPDDTQARHGIAAYPIRSRTWSLGGHTPAPVSGPASLKDRLKILAHKYPFVFRALSVMNTVFRRVPGTIWKEIVFLARAFRIVRSFDLFVITGGGQFLDSSGGPWKFVGGPWLFPFTIYKWLVLAKLANVRRIVLNSGAGPLVHPLTRLLVRQSISLADYVSFRDEHSRVLAQQIGFHGYIPVLPDSVYALSLPTLPAKSPGTGNRLVVGMSPMAYGDPRLSPEHDPAIYNSYIQNFASFAGRLMDHHHYIKLFCSDLGIDPPAADDVEKILKGRTNGQKTSAGQYLARVDHKTTSDLLRNMSSMDYVVTCRFHGIVFAHLLNIPVLAISHHPKMTGLMSELGLTKYCIDIRSLDAARLTDIFMAMMEDRCEIKGRMADRLSSYKKRLSAQFDQLFLHDLATPSTGSLSPIFWPLAVPGFDACHGSFKLDLHV
jgi:polysaccharide pyruvyl transferase WcaK-like protein